MAGEQAHSTNTTKIPKKSKIDLFIEAMESGPEAQEKALELLNDKSVFTNEVINTHYKNSIRKESKTPLIIASENGQEKVCEELLKRGADIKAKSHSGRSQTALHIAVIKQHPKTVEVLLRNKADTEAIDKNVDTPLHHAVRSRNKLNIKLLLKYGAKTDPKNRSIKTPVDLASMGKKSEREGEFLAWFNNEIEKSKDKDSYQVEASDDKTPLSEFEKIASTSSLTPSMTRQQLQPYSPALFYHSISIPYYLHRFSTTQTTAPTVAQSTQALPPQPFYTPKNIIPTIQPTLISITAQNNQPLLQTPSRESIIAGQKRVLEDTSVNQEKQTKKQRTTGAFSSENILNSTEEKIPEYNSNNHNTENMQTSGNTPSPKIANL